MLTVTKEQTITYQPEFGDIIEYQGKDYIVLTEQSPFLLYNEEHCFKIDFMQDLLNGGVMVFKEHKSLPPERIHELTMTFELRNLYKQLQEDFTDQNLAKVIFHFLDKWQYNKLTKLQNSVKLGKLDISTYLAKYKNKVIKEIVKEINKK